MQVCVDWLCKYVESSFVTFCNCDEDGTKRRAGVRDWFDSTAYCTDWTCSEVSRLVALPSSQPLVRTRALASVFFGRSAAQSCPVASGAFILLKSCVMLASSTFTVDRSDQPLTLSRHMCYIHAPHRESGSRERPNLLKERWNSTRIPQVHLAVSSRLMSYRKKMIISWFPRRILRLTAPRWDRDPTVNVQHSRRLSLTLVLKY